MGCVNTKDDVEARRTARRSTNNNTNNRTKQSNKSQKSNKSSTYKSTNANANSANNSNKSKKSNNSSSNSNSESAKKSTIVKSKFVDLKHKTDVVVETNGGQAAGPGSGNPNKTNEKAAKSVPKTTIAIGPKSNQPNPNGMAEDGSFVFEKREFIKGRDRLGTKVNTLMGKNKGADKEMSDKSDLIATKSNDQQKESNDTSNNEIYTNVKPEILKDAKHEPLNADNIGKVNINHQELTEAVYHDPKGESGAGLESKNSKWTDNSTAASPQQEPFLTVAIDKVKENANAALEYISSAWTEVKDEAGVLKDKVVATSNGSEVKNDAAQEWTYFKVKASNLPKAATEDGPYLQQKGAEGGGYLKEKANQIQKATAEEWAYLQQKGAEGSGYLNEKVNQIEKATAEEWAYLQQKGAEEGAYLKEKANQIQKATAEEWAYLQQKGAEEGGYLKEKANQIQKATAEEWAYLQQKGAEEGGYLKEKANQIQKATAEEWAYLQQKGAEEGGYLKQKAGEFAKQVQTKAVEVRDEVAADVAYIQEQATKERERDEAATTASYDYNSSLLSHPDQIIEQ